MPDFSFFEIGTRRKLTLINFKGQNTQYDMSLQQIVAPLVYRLGNKWCTKSATNHCVRTGEFLQKFLSLKQNSVAAKCCTNSF